MQAAQRHAPRPAAPTLHLIDGSGYIFRAYYAMRPMSTRAGVPTHAVVGFARMLFKLFRDTQPQWLGIAFDTSRPNFRHRLYAAYKANREQPPEDLLPQFALIHALVEALAIPILCCEDFEADDVLATLSDQARQQNFQVMLVSADKDLLQLVGPDVGMYDPMHDKLYDSAAVQARYGVTPRQLVDLLALAGDSSDNIPGVPRVGPKSAAKLINTFGDVEQIIAGLQQQPQRKAYEEAVLQHIEQARLSKRLASLHHAVPMQLQPAQLRYQAAEPQALATFLRRIEAYGLLRELGLETAAASSAPAPHVAPPKAPKAPDAANPAGPAPLDASWQSLRPLPSGAHDPQAQAAARRATYRCILSAAALQAVLHYLRQVKRFCIDLETTSLHAAQADIVGISLAAQGMHAVYIPVDHHYLGVPQQLTRDYVLAQLRPLLVDASLAKVGQHLKYDAVVLARAGIGLQGIVDDSLLASYVLDPARLSYGLDALANTFLGHPTLTYQAVTGSGKKRLGFDEVDLATACAYAAEDADVALALCTLLVPQIATANLQHVYRVIEMPLVPVLARMESAGVHIDSQQLAGLKSEFKQRLLHIENEAFKHIGAPINLSSPKQLAYLFFEKLGYTPVKKTKTGYSTDQEVLESLARTYELPQIILNHRLLTKLMSTYVDALPRMLNPSTGRLHTHFNQTGTATGRLSSSDPNLQNIPIRSDDGRRIRAAFSAPPGWEIISADYSQIELRILAHLAQDTLFIQAFHNQEDIHARTAQEILGHLQDSTPAAELRRRAKAINFGILYGLSEFGLSRQLQIGRAEAHTYIEAYFARYPQIRQFMDSSIEAGRRLGYVSTMSGRRRYLPNLRSKNTNLRQAAERVAMNTPIQGSAADLIKLAMIRVDAQLQAQKRQARLVLQVHDELVIESPHHERQAVLDLLQEHMTTVVDLAVPLHVDVGYGDNWAAAH